MENNIRLGEKRVQKNFSDDANDNIESIKQKYAELIDYLGSLRNEKNGREISIAQTECETSCMYAVKGILI